MQDNKPSVSRFRKYSLFERVISLNNLYSAWDEFKVGKNKKLDVAEFAKDLKNNILKLHWDLKNKTYQHSPYQSFYVKDPKLRHIHKACVRDRVLHHAIFRISYPIFDKSFIFNSYSSRLDKGTHLAVKRLSIFARKVSKNNTQNCYFLKCDVKKFFDSIDQKILISLIGKKIQDKDFVWLIKIVVKSFQGGIPLGNVTSQLFANVYLNELDKFIKHHLKMKYYLRYCDDFIILGSDKNFLKSLILKIDNFLKLNLNLSLHPNKIFIRKYHQGVDFLGYVSFPHYSILRNKTKKRMFRKIDLKVISFAVGELSLKSFKQTLCSYYGLLKHSNYYRLSKRLKIFILSRLIKNPHINLEVSKLIRGFFNKILSVVFIHGFF